MHIRVAKKKRQNYEKSRKSPHSQFNNSNYLVPFSLPPLTHLSKTVIAFCMQHTLLNNHLTDFLRRDFLRSDDFRLLKSVTPCPLARHCILWAHGPLSTLLSAVVTCSAPDSQKSFLPLWRHTWQHWVHVDNPGLFLIVQSLTIPAECYLSCGVSCSQVPGRSSSPFFFLPPQTPGIFVYKTKSG